MLTLFCDLSKQKLTVWQGRRCLQTYPISTARAGWGQQRGSGQTPLGWHRVAGKYGHDLALTAVLVGRAWTGRWWPDLESQESQSLKDGGYAADEDAILARVLWLDGLEQGYNRGGSCDTLQRYIYLHGTADLSALGMPSSHGCIRMDPAQICALFSQVRMGDRICLHL